MSVEKIKIPDDDAMDWIKDLHQLGFSFDEVENIMVWANNTFTIKTIMGEAAFDVMLSQAKEWLKADKGRELREDEIEKTRESLLKGLRAQHFDLPITQSKGKTR